MNNLRNLHLLFVIRSFFAFSQRNATILVGRKTDPALRWWADLDASAMKMVAMMLTGHISLDAKQTRQ